MEYLGTDLDIIRVLGITNDFLERQIDSNAMVESGDPTAIGKLVNENEIGAALRTIQTYKKHLEHQRDLLKTQIVKARVLKFLLSQLLLLLLGRDQQPMH